MFKRKNKCPRCTSKINDSFDFCPYCGLNLTDPEKDMKDFGMLGKNEMVGQPLIGGGGFGITDKMINSLMRNLMKSLESQMRKADDGNVDVQNLPNGINIKFGIPVQQKPKKNRAVKKGITQEQVERMSGMPRTEAKTNVRRLSDKVVYELDAAGVASPNDVFISKLENGYEVKAIGKKKVYVNSLPVNLPLQRFLVSDKNIVVEFGVAGN